MEWNYNQKIISIWFKHLPLNKVLVVEIDDWYEQIAHHYTTQNDKNSFIIRCVCKKDFFGTNFISEEDLEINSFDEIEFSLWKKGFFNAWKFCKDRPDLKEDKPIVVHFKRTKKNMLEIIKIEQEE